MGLVDISECGRSKPQDPLQGCKFFVVVYIVDPNRSINCGLHFYFLKGSVNRCRLQENDLQVGAGCHGGIGCSGTW
jgi:hypothetical protein